MSEGGIMVVAGPPDYGEMMIGVGGQWVPTSLAPQGAKDQFLSDMGVSPSNASYLVVALSSQLSAERRLQVGTGLSISDGGAGGDLTVSLDATLVSLAAYNTNGYLVQTAADTFAGRTLTGTASRLTITNGDGSVGNPVFDISTSYVGQATITTLGTITTGVWTGTTIAVANGGTGQTTYTNGQLLIGNTTGNTLTKATLTGTANQVTVTNGTGSITLSTPQDIATTSTPQFARMGIGTAATTDYLTVSGGAAAFIRTAAVAVSITNGTDSTLDFTPVGSGQVRVHSDLAGRFFTFADGDGTTDIVVLRGAKFGIGIGSATPDEKLHVSGNIKVTGNVTTGTWTGATVGVAYGGTGQTSWTANSLTYTSGTTTFASLGAATNGQLPIGSTGAAPVLAALTGTANQITVTNGAGSITLSTPQDIATGSTPRFARLGLGVAAAGTAGLNMSGAADNSAGGNIRGTIITYDSTALAQGTGSGIFFGGVYDSGGSQTLWAYISSYKKNNTDGQGDGDLIIGTRSTAAGLTDKLRIYSDGAVAWTAGTAATTNLTMWSHAATWNAAQTYTGLKVAITNTSSNAASAIVDFLAGAGGATSMFKVLATGEVVVPSTITAPGTTGNQTINKPAGRVNIAAAGTTVTVTNSLVTANSIVLVEVATADATARVTSVVPGAGSFVITTVAVTAETAFSFLVIS